MKCFLKSKTGKITSFSIFLIAAVIFGSWRELAPPIPTQRGDDPFPVSVNELDTHAAFLEGKDVTLTSEASNVSIENDTLFFQFTDPAFSIAIEFRIFNWSVFQGSSGTSLEEGNTYSVKGTSHVDSMNYVEVTCIHHINSQYTYMSSLVGLGIVAVLVFTFFKLDLKKLAFRKKRANTNPRDATVNKEGDGNDGIEGIDGNNNHEGRSQ
ncbi:MAG: hypothetical protein ACTSUE_02950 [Promethearchaeota archaeon]